MCGTDPEIFLSQSTNLPEAFSFLFKDVIQLPWTSSTHRLAPMAGPSSLTCTQPWYCGVLLEYVLASQ